MIAAAISRGIIGLRRNTDFLRRRIVGSFFGSVVYGEIQTLYHPGSGGKLPSAALSLFARASATIFWGSIKVSAWRKSILKTEVLPGLKVSSLSSKFPLSRILRFKLVPPGPQALSSPFSFSREDFVARLRSGLTSK